MYEELVKQLRNTYTLPPSVCAVMSNAANAIEDLEFACNRFEKDYKALCEYLPKWIPVTERLPERNQDVLVMVHWRDYPEDMMCYGRRFKTKWYLWNGELGELLKGFDITYWMPLPEPPKEET